jgi:RNA polymerase sigma-70 factor (ECF subfamily)
MREEFGDAPASQEYVERFPQFASDLTHLFQLHHLRVNAVVADRPAAGDASVREVPAAPSNESTNTSLSLLGRLRHSDDQEAWSRFVDLYTPVLYHWARCVGLSEADARDLLQEVFMLLLKKLPEFAYDPQKGSFRGWLKTVIMNKLREQKRKKREVAVGSNSHLLERPSDESEADRLFDEEFQRKLIGQAMTLIQRDFEPKTWQACWETAFCGRPAADVAKSLGMKLAAVYVARSRVLRRLREEMAGMID